MINNLCYATYQLEGAWRREGALIRVEWDGVCGFADVHPWPELGDCTLREQLRHFGKTKLTTQALRFSQIDAHARKKGISLLESLPIPYSHYLVTTNAIPQDWTHYKIKLEHLHRLPEIPKGSKVRIDCNGKLNAQQAEELFSNLDPEQIDFVEDPTFNIPAWKSLLRFGIPLAADRMESEHAAIQILKPAVEDITPSKSKVAVTSYLGHPLGQAVAAYYAGILQQKHDLLVCGLLSHHVYQTNAYSERLSQKGPTFTIPKGVGFGFDDLLEQEEWHAL